MLTKKQNLLETIRGGHPDRYVNQYEAIAMVYGPRIQPEILCRSWAARQ